MVKEGQKREVEVGHQLGSYCTTFGETGTWTGIVREEMEYS